MGRIVVLMLLLNACTNDTIRIRSEVQESFVPVFYCPAPTIPTRPVLFIQQLSQTQLSHPGEVAKHYSATIQQLLGYSRQLELELQKYDVSNQAYKDLQNKMDQKFVDDGIVTKEQLEQNQQGL